MFHITPILNSTKLYRVQYSDNFPKKEIFCFAKLHFFHILTPQQLILRTEKILF